MTHKIRLNKYLSLCGLGSRRKCDKYIEKGLIKINGEITQDFSMQVDDTDDVRYNDKPVRPEKIIYIALNKPVGVVTTLSDPEGRPTVAEYFKNLPLIKPVGRLDFNTSGLLILTNDGDLHYKLTHPKFQIPKLYQVIVHGKIDDQITETISRGIRLDDGKVARGYVKKIKHLDKNSDITLELREGINREIRRIFEKLNHRVIKLDRIKFAGIEKKGLSAGEWRYLDKNEVARLNKY